MSSQQAIIQSWKGGWKFIPYITNPNIDIMLLTHFLLSQARSFTYTEITISVPLLKILNKPSVFYCFLSNRIFYFYQFPKHLDSDKLQSIPLKGVLTIFSIVFLYRYEVVLGSFRLMSPPITFTQTSWPFPMLNFLFQNKLLRSFPVF